MKKLSTLVALGLIALSNVAFAADATCESKATDKKLAGAAKNSFMKKCEREAKASSAGSACEMQAADKKLKGAAKNSFVKKCTKDASAPAAAASAAK
ncbi:MULTISPECIES: hypothetical protein [unclassified Rhizobacter]|uniref:hypothetical protein n=1 Tax=unclassified Rhizobacter TaxID=2640088 RepID=UPI0006F2EACD|nr:MULTISPECIES: hypothetical protein [unclassified Rhizobacter]KQU76822.1 hypothetical protein ASC88_02515 [Rhizobacter sp. Root29]KQV97342.1 hypothetical protein ASC98_12045 [Rhizobacter sp. Root1238]KRB10014.1 hypothetical protein ASE08_10680 [Rhizobacter sp. Root16D2]